MSRTALYGLLTGLLLLAVYTAAFLTLPPKAACLILLAILGFLWVVVDMFTCLSIPS